MRQFGLIGYPLSHSFSESYFSEKFKKLGIEDAEYRLYPLPDLEKFSTLVASLTVLKGLNVTIPYKEKIIPFLDEISEEAEAIGAVNCIRISGGRLIGFNTDAFGFHQSIKPFLEPVHDRALILGTGGAAKAVAHVLRKLGISFYFVSRDPAGSHQLGYDQLNDMVMKHHLFIINTTPLGTRPKTEEYPPIPFEQLTGRHFVVDLIYNPAETKLLAEARQRGALVLNGLSMLQQQAEKSWEIWNQD